MKVKLRILALCVLLCFSCVLLTSCSHQSSDHASNPSKYDEDGAVWTVTVEATCTEPGEKQYTCSKCGFVQKQNIVLGHTYNENNVCTTCSFELAPSTGLKYEQSGDGTCSITGYKNTFDKNIVIPAYYEGSCVDTIVAGAFKDCKMSSIIIPETVKVIGNRAFEGSWVTSIKIPDGVLTIGEHTFYKSTLKNIVLPKSITQIRSYAFDDCTYLENIYFEGTFEEWLAIEILEPQGNFFGNANVYCYSATQPTEDNGGSWQYWHYVNGEITLW